jgi:hypothetical protein
VKAGGKQSSAGVLLGLFFDHADGGDTFLRKVGLTFNGLHCVISQMVELFITTGGRTSNPAIYSAF